MLSDFFIKQRNYKIFLLLIAFAGFAFILYLTSLHGPGISNDSVSYLSASVNLLKFNRFLIYDNSFPYSYWPPLFPLILSFFQVFGLDPVKCSVFLNAISFGGIIYLTGIFSNKILTNKYLIILAPLMVLVAPPLVYVYGYLWTEPLFIFCCMLFLYIFSIYQEKPTLKLCMLSALLVAAAIMMRYVGIICVGVATFLVLTQLPLNLKAKLKHIIIFCVISCLPLVIWIIRNVLVTNTLTGAGRTMSLLNPGYFTAVALETIWEWFLPYFDFLSASAVAPVFVLFLCFFYVLLYLNYKQKKYKKATDLLILLAVFTHIYLAFVIAASFFQSSSELDFRTSAPAVIPGYLMVLFVTDKLINKFNTKTIKYISVIICLLLLSNGFLYSYKYVSNTQEEGIKGYEDVKRKKSPTLNYAVNFLPSQKVLVYSNAPQALYYRYRLPYKKIFSIAHYYLERNYFKKKIEEIPFSKDQKIYLVWFYSENIPKGKLLERVLEVNNFKTIHTFPDGAILILEETE